MPRRFMRLQLQKLHFWMCSHHYKRCSILQTLAHSVLPQRFAFCWLLWSNFKISLFWSATLHVRMKLLYPASRHIDLRAEALASEIHILHECYSLCPFKSVFPSPVSSFLANANLLHAANKHIYLYNILFFKRRFVPSVVTHKDSSADELSSTLFAGCQASHITVYLPSPSKKDCGFFIDKGKLQNSL